MHGDGGDLLLVRGVVLDQDVRADVPHLQGLVRAACSQALALGVEGHGGHRTNKRTIQYNTNKHNNNVNNANKEWGQ
jgi:hypothetical protein